MKRILIFAAVSILLFSGLTFAQRGKGGGFGMGTGDGICGGRGPGMRMILDHAEDISLTEPQKDKIGQMMDKFALERIDKEAALEKEMVKMKSLRLNNGTDNEILAQIDKIGALKTDLAKMRFQHREAINDILTKEQLDKLEDIGREFRGRGNNQAPGPEGSGFRGCGMGPGQGPGDGPGPGCCRMSGQCRKR